MNWSGSCANSRRSRMAQDPRRAVLPEIPLVRKPGRHGVSALRSWAAWTNRAAPQTRERPEGRRAAPSSHLHLPKHPPLSLERRILRASVPMWLCGLSLLQARRHAIGEAFLNCGLDPGDAVFRVRVGAEELD